MWRMRGGVVKAYNVLKFRRSRAPRSDDIRLFRNLEMALYEKCMFRIGPYRFLYTRAPGKNTDDGVRRELLYTRRDRSRT